MPYDKARDTITRLLELLALVPSRGQGKTAAELQSALEGLGFNVTKRTVERDLINLETSLNLSCDDSKKPHRWSWPTKDVRFPPALELAEALSLRMLEEHLRPIFPASVLSVLEPRFNAAREKLLNLPNDNRTAHWLNKVRISQPTLPFRPPAINQECLEMVQEALLSDRQVDVLYDSLSGRKELRLHPLALYQRGVVTYLAAATFDYTKPVRYAVHRLLSVKITDESVKRPDNFDIDKFLKEGGMEFGGDTLIDLKVVISDQLVRHLSETPFADDMKIVSKNGRHILTATVPDSWSLRWWLSSQGNEAVVIAPTSLRDDMRERILEAQQAYDEITTHG